MQTRVPWVPKISSMDVTRSYSPLVACLGKFDQVFLEPKHGTEPWICRSRILGTHTVFPPVRARDTGFAGR